MADLSPSERELLEALESLVRGVQAWCDQISNVGTGWDDWDHHYKRYNDDGLDEARAVIARAKAKADE